MEMTSDAGKKLVYICSRYSGNTEGNTEKARRYCWFATTKGVAPIAPHLLLPQFLDEATERRVAMGIDMEILRRCDEVWAFGCESGISAGMAAELDAARAHRKVIRIFDAFCNEMREEVPS
ncbi:MAG: DUF4406 domain-containing protein [Clostridiales bacterium]|nr:DUF4406 domain-containing protein [Clostridiales bacterium]